MKSITLRESFKPYSTTPGICFPHPSTSERLQFFPTEIIVTEEGKSATQLFLIFPSPILQMRVFYHLFQERFEVQLKLEEGICHYHLKKVQENWILDIKRCSTKGYLESKALKKRVSLSKGKPVSIAYGPLKEDQLSKHEVLYFGSHKKSQVEKIYERGDLSEIVPYLFVLGQQRVKPRFQPKMGPFAYFTDVQKLIKEKKHDQLLNPLQELFRYFFTLGFMPHLEDIHRFGNKRECATIKSILRFDLLQQFYEIVRSFFFMRKQNELFFLPHLPTLLHCGKGVAFQEHDFHFSFEWSKKSLKKIELRAHLSKAYNFYFPKIFKSYRLRVDNKSYPMKNGQNLKLEKNTTYYFDRFEK